MENRTVREVLLVGCKSTSSYSTSVVNPFSGHALWSYKGNELRGAAANSVESVGIQGDFIAVSTSGQPFLHFITPTKKTTITTTLPGKPDSVRITKTGRFAFVLVNSKVYCYDLHSGELLKIAANSCLNATKMFLCPNDKYLAFPMNDGNLFVYKLASLLIRSSIAEEEVPPYCSYLSHSKEIMDISFSNFDSLFMMSVGLDHRLVLYCLNTRTEILKISFDVELTSCAFNLSDTTLYCGTRTGRLIVLGLFQAQQLNESTCIIQTQSDLVDQTHTIFDKHDGTAICKISMNLDGTRLATGDVEGKVMIWDVFGGQILARIRKDGEIHTLRFTKHWNSLSNPEHEPDTVIQKFQHEISDVVNPIVKTTNTFDAKRLSEFQIFEYDLMPAKTNEPNSKKKKPNANNEEDEREHLRLNNEITKMRAEIAKLRTENDRLCELLLSEESMQSS